MSKKDRKKSVRIFLESPDEHTKFTFTRYLYVLGCADARKPS